MSKRAILDFDIIEDKNSEEMPFDMIIGTKDMGKIKMILNFAEGLITWDVIELSMKPDGHFNSPENLCAAFIEATEPKEV